MLDTIGLLVLAVCAVESGGNSSAINIHDGGSPSYGDCQIKYSTAKELGYGGHISDLWLDRETNRRYARLYLEKQYKRYGTLEKAAAAYNTGSLKDGKIRNTRYVRKVMAEYHRLKRLSQ
jgi:hypothetical protein